MSNNDIVAGILHGNDPVPYGETTTYIEAANLFADCETVEDWGCGRGWFRQYLPDRYVGIDTGLDSVAQDTPFADIRCRLENYLSQADGILLRHVLEHNHAWDEVLSNAVASFRKVLVIILFTPLQESTQMLYSVGPPEFPLHEPNTPTYGFAARDLEKLCAGLPIYWKHFNTDTFYGEEHMMVVTR